MLKKIRLKNGRTLIAAYSLTRPKSSHWVVFLTESGSEFHDGKHSELVRLLGPRLARNFNYLVVNKPGISPLGLDRKGFESSFRRLLRISDGLQSMKKLIPQNHTITLIGYSEGAYLAPQIALKDRRVKSVVMIGGGTRGWLKEELSNAKGKDRKSVAAEIRQVYKHPTSLRKWHGFSYATWYSYREDSTLKALKKLKVPVLAFLGSRDHIIDFKSAIRDLKGLSKNHPVQVRVFRDCGHSFAGHWQRVRSSLVELIDFLHFS